MSSVFELIVNLVEGIIGTQYYIRYLGYKDEKHKGFTIAVMVLSHFFAITFCNYLSYMTYWDSLSISLTWFLVTVLLLKGRILEKIYLIGLNLVFSDLISIMLFSVFDKWIVYDADGYMEFGPTRIILVVIAKLTEFLLLEIILYFRIREKELVSNSLYIGLDGVVLTTLLASEMLTNIIYQGAYNEYLGNEAKLVVLALGGIDIAVYILCMRLINSNTELLKERMKNFAFESKMKDIRSAEIMHNQIMKIRHDMKNELLNIRLKINEGKIEAAEKYLEEVLNIKLAKRDIVFTKNILVDTVINRCVETCMEKGISIEPKVECIIEGVEEMDMAILLSNLLDNAVEAAVQSEEKAVSLRISRNKNYLNIFIKNSCKERPVKEKAGARTTKEDKLLHGYGRLNVWDIVTKYNGEYEENFTEKEYETFIVLYLKKLTA